MARLTLNAGIDPEFISSLGLPPWETKPIGGYVMGRFCDEGPLAPCLWADLRAAYSRNRIDHKDATIFEIHHLAHCSCRTLAKSFRNLTKSEVQRRSEAVRITLEADPKLGLITTIVEDCGGWEVVGHILFGR